MHHRHMMAIGIGLSVVAGFAAMAQKPVAPQAAAPAGVLAQSGTPAVTLLAEAVKAAKVSKKPVLLYYVGRREFADTFVSSAEAGKLLTDNYVIVRLVGYEFNRNKKDEPANPGTDSVVRTLGGGSPILPFLVLDSTGAKINGVATNRWGRPDSDEFGELLSKTAPSMSEADRKRITDYLTANFKQ